MLHFTYSEEIDDINLHQGDLLKRTKELDTLLKKYHPNFIYKNNEYFMVLTQSCDLYKREDKININYINICPVKSISFVLNYTSLHYRYTEYEKKLNFTSGNSISKIEHFIERLMDNNESEFFYLYREPSVGIVDDYCAFLRLVIPIHSRDYSILLKSKILQLSQPFEHKLGYLFGLNYSKIGTDDWSSEIKDEKYKNTFNQYISEIKSNLIIIGDASEYRAMIKELKKYKTVNKSMPSLEDMKEIAEDITKKTNLKIIKRREILKEELLKLGIQEETANKYINRLKNFPELKKLFN